MKRKLCMAFGDNIDIKELLLLTLNGKCFKWVTNAKHLDTKLNMYKSDHHDICLKKGSFIANTNKLVFQFQNCNHYVKDNLFWSLLTVIGVFGKRIYHAKNVPSLLSTTILAGNGIYHASNDL